MPQQFVPLLTTIVFFVVMYFILIRPQKKRQEREEELKNQLKVGDHIVTIGGIRGEVVEITDDSFILETSDEKTRMEFVKPALSYIFTPKDEYQKSLEEEEEAAEEDLNSENSEENE